MKKIFCLLALVFLCHNNVMTAQTVGEVITKVTKQASSPTYLSCNLKYNLYKDYETNRVYDSYTGVFKKNPSNSIYQKIKNTEFIFKGDLLLKVMHEDKVVMLSKVSEMGLPNGPMNELLKYCEVSSFKTLKNEWQLVLTPKQGSGLTYSKIVIWIDKSYRIQKQKFYYNTQMDFSDNLNKSDSTFPVLEVIYSNYKIDKIPDNFFSVKKYLLFKGKQVSLSGAYSKYTLEDYR